MRLAALAAVLALVAIPVLAQEAPTEDARMKAFKANDKNNDGKLDKAEYKGVLEALGFAELLDQLFEQRDTTPKDGFVSAEEYKTPIAQ
jgi:Ca2+-binding EF-hand superfamily protein